jgi:hypothetical protein
VLDVVVFVHAQRVDYLHHALGAEQAHQVVFQRYIETGLAGVALAPGTAAQLVVYAPGLVALRADNLQPAEFFHAVFQLDVGAAAGHVGGDRHRVQLPGFGNDLGFPRVVLGVQDFRHNALFAQHQRQNLGLVYRDGCDK